MATDILLRLAGLLVFVLLAQLHGDPLPVIDADNITRLRPVSRILFDSLPAAEVGDIASGRFFMSTSGRRLGVVNRENEIIVLADTGEPVGKCVVSGGGGLPATFIEGVFGGQDDVIVSIHTDGPASYYLSRCDALAGEQTIWAVPVALTELWTDKDNGAIWVADLNGSVMKTNDSGEPARLAVPSPETDPESVIRIGRITPPLAVTITEDGLVKRWYLETGAITAIAQVEAGLPIYGHLTPDGRYLVWRDPPSTALRLLDFETGTDQLVVALNGTYIPFVFVTLAGDTVIGAQLDDQPALAAWDVATGTHHDLGKFQPCSRPPDMVRLSADGTTLVIGCDTGLEIWRIQGSDGR